MLPRRFLRLQRTWLRPETLPWQSPASPEPVQGNPGRKGLDPRLRVFSTDSEQVSPSAEVPAAASETMETNSQAFPTSSPGQTQLRAPRGAVVQSQEPTRTHQFDTFKLVSALQIAGYSHSQAVALMKCLRTVLINGNEVAKAHYLSRGDLENVTVFFT